MGQLELAPTKYSSASWFPISKKDDLFLIYRLSNGHNARGRWWSCPCDSRHMVDIPRIKFFAQRRYRPKLRLDWPFMKRHYLRGSPRSNRWWRASARGKDVWRILIGFRRWYFSRSLGWRIRGWGMKGGIQFFFADWHFDSLDSLPIR